MIDAKILVTIKTVKYLEIISFSAAEIIFQTTKLLPLLQRLPQHPYQQIKFDSRFYAFPEFIRIGERRNGNHRRNISLYKSV